MGKEIKCKLLKKIRCKKGTLFTNVPFVFMFFSILIAFFMKLYPSYILKGNLDTFASEIARVVSISGDTTNINVERRIKSLEKSLGVKPIIQYNKNGRINLDEEFIITISEPLNIDLGFFKYRTILTSQSTGISEVYFK